ncbi:MAG: 4Fe-4S dicluster domain-containing protein [Candidatus Eisenbacteria bacterium]|nr:4Fe-4S dicluster domain-containing protein [Candidatus Latescibacterota bacterium]MBD3301291.1 4Fe-4S dicluster domain-containing protein [Candidatus Eisenbacteria bacterium]
MRETETRWVMVLDTRRCVGCSACVIGCKEENDVPHGGFRDWVTTETRGGFPNLRTEHRSERCNHCGIAPCVDNCPTGASYRGRSATVQIDRIKCTGCKNCIAACPYGARFVDPRGFIDKCTFCAHLGGGTTSCAEICPTACIVFGDAADPRSEVSRLLATRPSKTLLPETGTDPQVYYLV